MSDNKFTRRDFLKATLAGSSALVAPTIISYLGKSYPSSDKEFLEVRDGNFYLGGEEYIIKGANYITRDYPHRMFGKYDQEKVEKELERATALGINSLRVPISFPHGSGLGPDCEPLSDIKINKEYFSNFEDFLNVADKFNLKVMPIAVDHPWNAELKKKGKFDITKNYLEEWVPEFKDDERILAWDAQNEPELNQRKLVEKWNVPPSYSYPNWTRKIADLLEELDPKHPVTIGLSDTDKAGSMGADISQQKFREEAVEALPKYIDHEDFYSFHYYTHLKFFKTAVDKIKEQTDKPIVLQEFGLPTTGEEWRTEEDQEWYYKKILKWAMEEDLSGVMFWELNDHPDEAVEDNPYMVAKDYSDDMGVLRNDYSKKPAAHVVEQYYKWTL